MTITVQIVTKIEDNNWVLEFELNLDATIPRDIFVFENTGAGIGEYQGVCSLEDYRRFQTHVEVATIGIFGNKFLKYHKGKMKFSIDIDPQPIRDKIISDVRTFKAAFLVGESSSATYTI